MADPAADAGAPPRPATWTSSLDRFDYEQRVRRDPGADPRRRVLPGEPHPPARRTRARPGRAWDAVAAGNPAPHAMFWRERRRPGADGRLRVARAVPARRRRRGGDPSDQGHRRPTRPAAGEREGPRRERDDRGPRPQRPRSRVPSRAPSRSPSCAASSTHPGLVHLVSTVRGTRRADVGLGALLRATFPPASITGAPKPRVMQAIEDLEPVRARRLLRRDRLVRRRPRRAPTSPSRSARSRAPPARTTFGVGRRDHHRLGPGGRVGRDRAQGRPPARASPAARPSRALRRGGGAAVMQVCVNGELGAGRRAADLAARPRAARRRRRLRDAARLRRRAVRLDPPPAAARPLGGRARPRASPRSRRCAPQADAVLAANDLTEARLRITITGGPAPLGSERAAVAADRRRRRERAHAVAADRRRRDRALAPQRARRDRRAQDDLVRGERAGARLRPRARRGRGDLRQHARRAVRGDRVRTCSWCEDGALRHAARGRAGCLLGVTRALVLRARRRARRSTPSRPTARSTRSPPPTRRSCRRPPARCRPSPTSTVRAARRTRSAHRGALAEAFVALVALDQDP